MGTWANLLNDLSAFWTHATRGPEPLSLQEALPRLVPKVRPRLRYEALGVGGGGPVFQPLAGTLAFSLVVDCPNGEQDVGARELQAWGADFDVLLQRARTNLLRRGGEECFREVGRGLYRSTWEDNLDGSRVLLPGVLKRLPLRGDPVVVLPSRDTLLVAGSEDPGGLELLLGAAVAFLREDSRFLNGCPLRLRNFQWEPWVA